MLTLNDLLLMQQYCGVGSFMYSYTKSRYKNIFKYVANLVLLERSPDLSTIFTSLHMNDLDICTTCITFYSGL